MTATQNPTAVVRVPRQRREAGAGGLAARRSSALPPRPRTGPRRRPWVLAVADLTLAVAVSFALLPGPWVIPGACLWTTLVALAGGYPRRALPSLRSEARQLVGVLLVGVLIVEAADLLWTPVPRRAGIALLLVQMPVSLAWRFVALRFPTLGGYAYGRRKLLVVGTDHGIRTALHELAHAPRGFVVSGVCVLEVIDGCGFGVPAVHGFDRILEACRRWDADAVLMLNGHRLTADKIRRLTWGLEVTDTELLVATGLLDVSPRRAMVASAGPIPTLQVRRAELHGARRVVKDVVERLAALVLLLCLTPVLIALMVLVRVDSPGSPVFRQRRIGRNERPFLMYKLRTMCVDAEARRVELDDANESDGLLFKIRLDPRITRVGRALRKYSLDELPQLWNVVRGDMALVGPRPATPDEVARYDLDARRRMAVKPGLTGLWQVSGRSNLSWEQSVRLDLEYVDNWSLGRDAMIVARTARAVLSHEGAY